MSHNNNNQPHYLNKRLKTTKTEVCKRFQRGICGYGDKCCFIHCNNNNEKYSKPCWRFMNGETCQYGEKCHFTHGFKSNRTSVVVDVMNGDELKEFRKMQMTWKKTRLCHKWMATGSCPYGTHCLYAHGVSELHKGSSEWLVKTCEENMDGKGWEFRWKNGGKIIGVYADWIDDTPLDV
nr:zinc finger CCCH domain-containing protein 39-like [Tanacetum cinerariifolium]